MKPESAPRDREKIVQAATIAGAQLRKNGIALCLLTSSYRPTDFFLTLSARHPDAARQTHQAMAAGRSEQP